MPKDRDGKPLKKGDQVGVMFVVDETTQEGTGTNLRLKPVNVPEGEHAQSYHINSACVVLIGGTAEATPSENTPATGKTEEVKTPPS